MAELLDDGQISAALDTLPAWRRAGDELQADYLAPDFPAGIELVVAVAGAAERAEHHPDIDIRWRTVSFRLSTHSAGGITELDIALAREIDALARRAGVPPVTG